MPRSFAARLAQAAAANGSLLCLGLDPDPLNFPAHFAAGDPGPALLDWGKRLIDQTADLVCCYKPNSAFYEQFRRGRLGGVAPDHRGRARATSPCCWTPSGAISAARPRPMPRAAFDELGADAVTLNPYLGRGQRRRPFWPIPARRPSCSATPPIPSAAAIQEFGPEERLFEQVARQAISWGAAGADRPGGGRDPTAGAG